MIVALLSGVGLGALACRGDDAVPAGPPVTRAAPTGEPRRVTLALGAVPAGQTTDAYIAAFATAARYADVILIQRAPPWSEFLPGGHVTKATEDLTRLEMALARQYQLRVFFVIDPTDPAVERSRLIDVPPGVDTADGLGNRDLRAALAGYAAYVARNYRPAYLAIGAEVDMYAERRPDQFEGFVGAYEAAYDVARAASPGTLVFPTFQLEDLEGNFGPAHPPRWDLLASFEGRIDALAVTTFPFLAKLPSARALRPDYYAQLRERFPGPIIIAAAGYTSVPVDGSSSPGTEEDQLGYVERLRDDSEKLGFELVTWLAAADPPVSPAGPSGSFRGIGLLRVDGSEKLAWAAWEAWSRRPLEAAPR